MAVQSLAERQRSAEANIYNDRSSQIVFNAGWMVTMVGSDVRRANADYAKVSRGVAVIARTAE